MTEGEREIRKMEARKEMNEGKGKKNSVMNDEMNCMEGNYV